MNKHNKLNIAMGDSRAEHAAMIAMNAMQWNGYEQMHNNVFAEANLEKYKVYDVDGNIIANSADKQALVTNANGTVRHEDFMVIRDAVIEVRRRSLTGISDLREAGLTFQAAIGDQLIGFETVNEFAAANQDMNPNSFDNNDTVFGEDFVPNPITHSSFSVPWRQQGFDYKRSLGLSESLRQTAERLEETLFNGNSNIAVKFNGSTFPIYGYTTDPNRGTATISDWTNPANNDAIVNELITQIGLMHTTQGGVGLNSVIVYLSKEIWNVVQKDYNSTYPSKTLLARMKDIAEVKDVKPAEKINISTQVVLVEMEKRTVELAIASDIVVIPHTKLNAMAPQKMTTYAAMVQKIKADNAGNTGVRVLNV